jgi:hypothetical protein
VGAAHDSSIVDPVHPTVLELKSLRVGVRFHYNTFERTCLLEADKKQSEKASRSSQGAPRLSQLSSRPRLAEKRRGPQEL